MVKRNTSIISQKEYDGIRMENGQIVEESVIPKGSDMTLDEVSNVCTIQKVPDTNLNKNLRIQRGQFQMRIIKIDIKGGYNEFKRRLFRKLQGNHVSLKSSNFKDTKQIEHFLVGNITEINYPYEDEKPPCHSESDKTNDPQRTLNSVNDFLISLAI